LIGSECKYIEYLLANNVEEINTNTSIKTVISHHYVTVSSCHNKKYHEVFDNEKQVPFLNAHLGQTKF